MVSRGIPVVVAKQSTKPRAAIQTPFRSKIWFDDPALQALVISVPVVVFPKLIDRPSQGGLPAAG
jgi:hypothetical protein